MRNSYDFFQRHCPKRKTITKHPGMTFWVSNEWLGITLHGRTREAKTHDEYLSACGQQIIFIFRCPVHLEFLWQAKRLQFSSQYYAVKPFKSLAHENGAKCPLTVPMFCRRTGLHQPSARIGPFGDNLQLFWTTFLMSSTCCYLPKNIPE